MEDPHSQVIRLIMKAFICVCLLVIATVTASLEEQEKQFQAFKLKHEKTYLNQVEETKRFSIFKNNLQRIEEHNALYEQGLVTYTQGINKFSDLTQEEFRSMLTLHMAKKPVLNITSKYEKSRLEVPTSVDWRTDGQVSEVKDQGTCGGCWAFSITGSVEGAYKRKNGKLVSLSEQQLIDCTFGSINIGCSGGYLGATFPYVESTGLESEADYPYDGVNGNCRFDGSKVVTKISGYTSIDSEDENALHDAVANVGPVSVAMDASFLSSYSTGIYEDDSCRSTWLNHAVLIVGYGFKNGQAYWIVKNSWGADWGESGYFRIVRGANECGIAEEAVYPSID